MFVKRVINSIRYCSIGLDAALKNPNSNLRRNCLDKVYSKYTVYELQKTASGEVKYLPSPEMTPLTGRQMLNKIYRDHFSVLYGYGKGKAQSITKIVEDQMRHYASNDVDLENIKIGIKKMKDLGLLKHSTGDETFKDCIFAKRRQVGLTARGEKVLFSPWKSNK